MKFGILSDLHNEFYKVEPVVEWDFNPQPDVFYLNAGDTDSYSLYREKFFNKHQDHMYSVLGNHDYYMIQFPYADYGIVDPIYFNGYKIAGATLWTDLSNYLHWTDYINGLVDYRHIDKMTYENYNEAYKVQKHYLLNSDADIIVSHHAPSYMSMHPRYKGSIYNPGFMTELSKEIKNMKKPPKLWVHGHVHDSFDYMIGETRVVCHPRGYLGEVNFLNYEPKILEI